MIRLCGELDRAQLPCSKRDKITKVFWTVSIQEIVVVIRLPEYWHLIPPKRDTIYSEFLPAGVAP